MEVNKQKKRPQSIEDLAYAIKFDFDKYNKNKLMRGAWVAQSVNMILQKPI